MSGQRCIFLLFFVCLTASRSVAQEESANEFSQPYPTRSEGPSVQFGQGYQSVAPSMPYPATGRIKVEPRVESPQGGAAKEAVVTAEVKALVFVEKEAEVKPEGVPGAGEIGRAHV